MPTYEYKCPEGHITTEIRSMKDPQSVFECSTCGAEVKRIFAPIPATIRPGGTYAAERRREFGL